MTRDILCSDCSDIALRVPESPSAEHILDAFGKVTHCQACGERGSVQLTDDGEAPMLVFRCHIPYEPSDLFGELRRQVEEERKRQQGWEFEDMYMGCGDDTRVTRFGPTRAA